MKKIKFNSVFFAVYGIFLLSGKLFAQEDLSVFPYWNYYGNVPSSSFYKHLVGRASMQLDARKRAIEKLKTKQDWQKRQAEVRIKLANAAGPFPEKTPLNAVITGTLKRNGFKVEKLYFESRPDYYVTAALFIPDKRSDKSPAIVYCSGHSPNGFRSTVYQNIILNYVMKGFIVLAFDPIGQGERMQYTGAPVKMEGEAEHSYPGAQSFISGLPPANYFIWDGIRAIDYLISRKEVDASRIGITGRSGGGTQTAYIAAIDERILASAPECYITTFDKLLHSRGPQDAEQNLMYGLERGIDMADFLEVRAPKPTLMVTTSRDIFSIQGAIDAFRETQRAYNAFGKPGFLNFTEDDAGHASTLKNREASYAFFQKFLKNPGDSTEVAVEPFSDQELYATPGGQVQAFLNGQTMFSLNLELTQKLVAQRALNRKSTPVYKKDLRDKIVAISGYEKPSVKSDIVFSGRLQRAGYAVEKYLVKGSGAYYLPVLWLKPKNSSGKKLLLLHDMGKSFAAKTGEMADVMAKQGVEIIIPDLSGIGELSTGYMKGGDSVIEGVPLNLWFAGILTHKNLVAVRAEEISILTDFIKSKISSGSPISASAFGSLTSDLLHAAAINNSFDKLVLINPLISYASISEERFYKVGLVLSAVPGALPIYDLPDLTGLTNGKLLMINPVNGAGEELSPSAAEEFYNHAQKPTLSKNLIIKCAVSSEDFSLKMADWMK